MLNLNRIHPTAASPTGTLTLSFDERVKSRQRVILDNGQAAGLFMERGTILQQGDLLAAESGEIIQVIAAPESVSTAYVTDPLMMARCSYHLGNRHVPLQIAEGFLRYQHDHVLDNMLRGQGVEITLEQAPFEPEAGAYGTHRQTHEHSAGHDHAH
mgnify:CR=1 FL=1